MKKPAPFVFHMNSTDEKYNIICLSNQLWDFPNWTNKRHVMDRLARRGHTVLFVDPPINLGFVFIRQLSRGYWSVKRILTQAKKDDCGAVIFSPVNFLPFYKITTKYHLARLKKLARKNFDPARKTILWIYHVQARPLFMYVDGVAHDVLVYDCVDNYSAMVQKASAFSTLIPQEEVAAQEQKLTKQADVVFVTAPGILEKLKAFNTNVHFTPNVGDYERFKDTKSLANELPEDLKAIPRPRIGYIGALDSYKFDLELVKKVAMDHPTFHFVIIGPFALKDKEGTKEGLGFEGLQNVHFLGSRPYGQKAHYLAGFDVDTIPYVLNDYTVGGCFPVKFHDSLAAGLPVVVTDLPAYLPFRDVCYISKNYEEFSKNIELALREDSPDKIKQRQAIAKENNWDGKVDKMLRIISEKKLAK